jgi:signal transduction histidine kinase/CheY-like chemotaxis protein
MWAKSQSELNERLRKFNFAIKAANMVFWEADPRTKHIWRLNDPMLLNPVQGKNHETEMTFDEFTKYIHPNDVEKVTEVVYRAIKYGPGEAMAVDARLFYETDREWHYCTISAIPLDFDDQGNVTKYVGFRKDNTELVKAQHEFKTFSEKMDYMMHESGIQMWNYDIKTRHFQILSGTNKLDFETTLDEYLSRLEEPERSEAKQTFENAASGKSGIFSHFRKVKKKGTSEIRYIIFSGMPIFDKDGKIDSYFGMRRDVTDLITVQKRLEEEMVKAQESDKLKSAFLANMSHEIRTPLNSIVGFSNLLENCDDPQARAKYIEIININNDALLNLINDILDLSKLESGMIEIDNREFDMASNFDNAIEALRQKMKKPHIQFISDNPYQRCVVISDQNRVNQIINNYCTNAFKYTEAGYVKAGYRYENNGIKIYVEDTGKGIPKDKQGLLFHRFEKLGSFVQGTGLGLAICKAITDAFKGDCGVDSDEGKGSKFWAWIPCEKVEIIQTAQGADDAKPDTSSMAMPYEAPAIQEFINIPNLKILVAEDNDSNFLLLKSYLIGQQLDHATDGKQAVEMAAKNKNDIILMDIKMPVMDGLEATKLIRESDSQIPIIALTAYAFDDDEHKALLAGCNGYLTKPLRENALKEMISSLVTK